MNTTRFFSTGLIAGAAALTGCATQPQGVNYGHPALYAVQPAVVVVQQPQPVAQRNDAGRAAVGALAGGVIGSQFGGSHNARTAAAVAGAGLGAWMAVRD